MATFCMACVRISTRQKPANIRTLHVSCKTFNTAVSYKTTESYLVAPGASRAKFESGMTFTPTQQQDAIPIYRVLNPDGKLFGPNTKPAVSDDTVLEWYRNMLTISILDKIMLDAQRQGRLSFYLTAEGEEAIGVGAAAALHTQDFCYAQYREQGAILQRGFSIKEFMSQLFANKNDKGKGRNMPVQYGSAELNFHTISAPLGTQIPQAAGAAYSLKHLHQHGRGPPAIVACFFGEGAASEGDFHAGLNIAATRECPVVYLCRNNGYAISTPHNDQYRGDGIASRAVGYGIRAIRADGNDIFAVYNAMLEARRLALEGNCQPILIEAMTYRVAHHSTSDDSFAYRRREDVELWRRSDGGINRLRKYLENNGLWSDKLEKETAADLRRQILKELGEAERASKPPIRAMFQDIYEKDSQETKAQMRKLKRILEKYPGEYPLQDFDGGIEDLDV